MNSSIVLTELIFGTFLGHYFQEKSQQIIRKYEKQHRKTVDIQLFQLLSFLSKNIKWSLFGPCSKNHTRISYRRLCELSKKYRDSNTKNIDLLKFYAEQLNFSVEAMKKMDWLIFRYYRPKKKPIKKKDKQKNKKH